MKKGGGKQKGNSFENKIATTLSEWLSDGKSKDLFCRSPGSGSRATVHLKLGTFYSNQAGDIIATGDVGYKLTSKYMIECKHYQNLNLEGMIYGTKAGVPEFWIKACKEAKEHNKKPMLIARQNNRPIILGLTKDGHLDLEKYLNSSCIGVFFKKNFYIYLFEDFLQFVPPKKFLAEYKPIIHRYKL